MFQPLFASAHAFISLACSRVRAPTPVTRAVLRRGAVVYSSVVPQAHFTYLFQYNTLAQKPFRAVLAPVCRRVNRWGLFPSMGADCSKGGEPPICCDGGKGTFLGGDIRGGGAEALLYLFILLWLFAGVGLISDIFMSAIESITSQTYTVTRVIDGTKRHFRLKVWNDTVANLTLMALGSSAPEILLSIIELVFKNNMKSGELGPSTIVGSAAFNLVRCGRPPKRSRSSAGRTHSPHSPARPPPVVGRSSSSSPCA